MLKPALTHRWIEGSPVHLLYPQPKLMPKHVCAFADGLVLEITSDSSK